MRTISIKWKYWDQFETKYETHRSDQVRSDGPNEINWDEIRSIGSKLDQSERNEIHLD